MEFLFLRLLKDIELLLELQLCYKLGIVQDKPPEIQGQQRQRLDEEDQYEYYRQQRLRRSQSRDDDDELSPRSRHYYKDDFRHSRRPPEDKFASLPKIQFIFPSLAQLGKLILIFSIIAHSFSSSRKFV